MICFWNFSDALRTYLMLALKAFWDIKNHMTGSRNLGTIAAGNRWYGRLVVIDHTNNYNKFSVLQLTSDPIGTFNRAIGCCNISECPGGKTKVPMDQQQKAYLQTAMYNRNGAIRRFVTCRVCFLVQSIPK